MKQRKTLLVVDDIADNIDYIKDVLKRYRVKAALSGEQALKVLERSDDIDLILLDIMMPEMDGFEVCRRIKANQMIGDIPIIFITAMTEEDSIERAYSVGGLDYVTKPFKPKELLSRVETQLKLHDMLEHLEVLVESEIKKRKEKERMLIQQSKMAAMGEMMDAVAHQWKQPLNALSLYSDLIKRDFEEGEIDQAYIEEFSHNIQFQINHMVETLDEFRTFFRPNKSHERFLLSDVITSVIVLMKDECLKSGIEVVREERDSLILYGSPNEFKHLLINLINNAKDAFEERDIRPRRVVIRVLDKGDRVCLEVEDNAGGIPEEILPNIFKANVTSKAEGKGTGIGLYMSHQIAQKYHATLEVFNRHGGACFIVTFDKHVLVSYSDQKS